MVQIYTILDEVDFMNNNELLVSVVFPTYNHEKFIEQAINSILKQKVNFNYEVLIGEDASTDKTSDVLKNMEKYLPQNFHIFYRKKNLGMIGNFYDLIERAKGKYIINLEGDDYWIYDLKLQKQVDFLETHPEYIAIAHNTLVVDKFGRPRTDFIYPECKKDEYTLTDFLNFILMGQTTTILYRNFYKTHIFEDIKLKMNYPGDQKLNFLLACHGKIKVIQEKWSAYRYINDEGTSFSATSKFDREMPKKDLIFLKTLMNYAFNNVKNEEAKKVIETKYLYVAQHHLRNRIIDYKMTTWIQEFMNSRYKIYFIKFMSLRIFKKVLRIIKNFN